MEDNNDQNRSDCGIDHTSEIDLDFNWYRGFRGRLRGGRLAICVGSTLCLVIALTWAYVATHFKSTSLDNLPPGGSTQDVPASATPDSQVVGSPTTQPPPTDPPAPTAPPTTQPPPTDPPAPTAPPTTQPPEVPEYGLSGQLDGIWKLEMIEHDGISKSGEALLGDEEWKVDSSGEMATLTKRCDLSQGQQEGEVLLQLDIRIVVSLSKVIEGHPASGAEVGNSAQTSGKLEIVDSGSKTEGTCNLVASRAVWNFEVEGDSLTLTDGSGTTMLFSRASAT